MTEGLGASPIYRDALEQAIRADERAKAAHERIDRLDRAMGEGLRAVNNSVDELRRELLAVQRGLDRLNTKAALAAGVGGLVGSGIIMLSVGLILSVWG